MWTSDLSSETVKRAARLLQGEDNIQSRDRLPAAVLGVRDRVADQVLKEELQDGPGLLVDSAGNALDATTAGKATDRRLKSKIDQTVKGKPYLKIDADRTKRCLPW